MEPPLRGAASGDLGLRRELARLSAAVARLQRLVAQLESTRIERHKITATFPLEVRRHPGGVHVSLAHADRDAHVELTSNLSSGGSATAKLMWYEAGVWSDAATGEITVHDVTGSMEGSPGDKALVSLHRQSGLWIVWQLQC